MIRTVLSERLVFGLLFFTATMWGLNVTIVKMLTEYFDVVLLSALRMTTAAASLGILIRIGMGPIPPVTRKQIYWLLFIGFFVVYSHQTLLALGLQMSSATNGSLIFALNPLLSVALSFWIYKESLTFTKIIGLILGFFGVCLVVLNKSGAQWQSAGIGDVILLGSVIAYVIGALGIRKVSKEVDPLVLSFYMHAMGAGMLFVQSAATAELASPEVWMQGIKPWLLILLSGVFSTAIGNLFWNIGITTIGVGRTSVFFNWIPVSGLLSAIVFLGERIRFIHLVGLVLILTGVYLSVHKKTEFALNDNQSKKDHSTA